MWSRWSWVRVPSATSDCRREVGLCPASLTSAVSVPRCATASADLAYDHARPVDDAGQLMLAAPIVTLSHEPQHSKGIAEEFVAECNAIQLANTTGVRLGTTAAYAASLVRAYWRHYGEELPAYRSADCGKRRQTGPGPRRLDLALEAGTLRRRAP